MTASAAAVVVSSTLINISISDAMSDIQGTSLPLSKLTTNVRSFSFTASPTNLSSRAIDSLRTVFNADAFSSSLHPSFVPRDFMIMFSSLFASNGFSSSAISSAFEHIVELRDL